MTCGTNFPGAEKTNICAQAELEATRLCARHRPTDREGGTILQLLNAAPRRDHAAPPSEQPRCSADKNQHTKLQARDQATPAPWSVRASKMVGWELAKFSPHSEPFANAGWNKYERDGHKITNLYINNSESTPKLAVFRTVYHANNQQSLEWCRRNYSKKNLKVFVRALASAGRITSVANDRIRHVVGGLMKEEGGIELDEGRCAELEKRYSQAISKDLSDDIAALRAATRAEAKEDLVHLKNMCERLRKKHFGHLDPDALAPPTGERAMALALVNYPEVCREIMKKFCAYGARRLEGGLLDDVRNYLRDSRILHMMVKKAYPKLSAEDVNKLCRRGSKTKRALIHIDHYIAQLGDGPHHFVAMIGGPNMSFGASRRHIAKDLYVTQEVADAIRAAALETIRGVRAVIREGPANGGGDEGEEEAMA